MANGAYVSQALRETLLSYMTSALPIGNHRSQHWLGQRFYNSWMQDLFKGPYVETVPSYEKLDSLAERLSAANPNTLAFQFARRFEPRYQWADVDNRFLQARRLRDRLWAPDSDEASMEDSETYLSALWNRHLFQHQWAAFERVVREKRSIVVATGTGSGKTECFQLPILYSLLTEAAAVRQRGGIRALLIYPLNALVEDQMMRLRHLLFWINLQCFDRSNPDRLERPITFGRYTGETPVDRSDHKRQAPPEALEGLGEIVYRDDMQAQPPDILITNFTMLEYILLREDDRQLFASPDFFRFLVLDEIHTYSGTRGMEVAMLLRRLRAFLEAKAKRDLRIVSIGTSATLGGEEAKPLIGEFARVLFSADFGPDDIILGRTLRGPSAPWEPERWGHLLRLLKDVDVRTPTLASFMRGQSSKISDTDLAELANALHVDVSVALRLNATAERMGRLLEASGVVHQLRSELEARSNYCADLGSLAELFSTHVHDPRDVAGKLLSLIGSATLHREAMVSLRTHFFVNEAREAQLCIFTGCEPELGGTDEWWRRLYISHHTTCDKCKAPVYSVLLCRRCGFVYLQGWAWDNRLWPERDIAEDSARYERWLFRPGQSEVPDTARMAGELRTICLQCGRYFVDRKDPHFAQSQTSHECSPDRLATVIVWKRDALQDGLLQECYFCEQTWIPGEEVVTPPAPSSYAVSTVLLEEMNRQLGSGQERAKIVSFSDTRQAAAQLALRLQNTNREFTFRQLLFRFCQDGPKTTDDLLDELYEMARGDTRLRRLFVAEPLRVLDNTVLREQLANLLYSEAVRAYLTLEAQGLVRIQYPQGLLDRAANVRHSSLILGRMTPAERLTWFVFMLDWGMRFVRFAMGSHPWGGPAVNAEGLREWNIFPKVAALHGSSDQAVVSFIIRQRNKRNSLFNLASRLYRNYFGTLGELELEEFHAATVPFWEQALASPDLWAKCANEATKPLLNRGGNDPARCLLQINFSSLVWRQIDDSEAIFRCNACGRISFSSLAAICPIRDCRGALEEIRPAQIDEEQFNPVRHYRRLVKATEPVSLWVDEHTAQVSTTKRSQVERDFRSTATESLDVVCGSTTFELGIDLGSIQSVFLSNLPPRAANYRQRAGRAGRRPGSQPFVLNYVRQRPHDQYFWNDPQAFVAGSLPVPRLGLTSREVVFRHLVSVFVGRLLEIYRQEHPGRIGLTGPAAGKFVDFCLAGATDSTIRQEISSTSLLQERLTRLLDGLPMQFNLLRCWRECLDRLNALRNTYLPLYADEGALDVLSDHGILPSYAFPIYVDELRLWQHSKWEPPRADLKLQRDRSIALREYSPGHVLVAGKHLIVSEGLWEGYEVKPFQFCRACGHLEFWSREPLSCSRCGSPYVQRKAVVPRGGFWGRVVKSTREGCETDLPDIVDLYFDPGDDPAREFQSQGGGMTVGMLDAGHMLRARMRMLSPRPWQDGISMSICQVADAALPHSSPAKCLKWVATGQGDRFHLMHEFTTDIVQVRFLDNPIGNCLISSTPLREELAGADPRKQEWLYDSVWLTLGTALALSGTHKLDIDPTEINVIVRRVADKQVLAGREIILFDTTPGGAGYARQLGDEIRDLTAMGLSRLTDCDCQDSCYSCLRTYHNQAIHNRLNWQRVREGLRLFAEANWQ